MAAVDGKKSFKTGLTPSGIVVTSKGDGYHDLSYEEFQKVCNAEGHYLPEHIEVPEGKKHIHTCLSCGKKSVKYSDDKFPKKESATNIIYGTGDTNQGPPIFRSLKQENIPPLPK